MPSPPSLSPSQGRRRSVRAGGHQTLSQSSTTPRAVALSYYQHTHISEQHLALSIQNDQQRPTAIVPPGGQAEAGDPGSVVRGGGHLNVYPPIYFSRLNPTKCMTAEGHENRSLICTFSYEQSLDGFPLLPTTRAMGVGNAID